MTDPVLDILWRYVALPLIHWAAVTLLILVAGAVSDAARLAREARGAISAPMPHRMAELTFQITRADGTTEPPRTLRTYRNPLRQWAWAIKEAFADKRNQ